MTKTLPISLVILLGWIEQLPALLFCSRADDRWHNQWQRPLIHGYQQRDLPRPLPQLLWGNFLPLLNHPGYELTPRSWTV